MTPFEPKWSPRPSWADAPSAVRTWAADLLGQPIASATDCSGGFSAGVAARLSGAGGARLFVKAACPELNPVTPRMYRNEARANGALRSAALPAPALRGTFDDGDWVAIAFDDIDGRPPQWPWTGEQLELTLVGLAEFHRRSVPPADCDLPDAASELSEDLGAWPLLNLAPSKLAAISPWLAEHSAELGQRATHLDLSGETVLHLDIRADNVLIDSDHRVWFIDWSWACRGPAVLDVTLLLVNAGVAGHDPQAWLGRSSAAETDPDTVTGAIAVLTGIWALAVTHPAPAGTRGLREFQRAHLDAATRWLQQRLAA